MEQQERREDGGSGTLQLGIKDGQGHHSRCIEAGESCRNLQDLRIFRVVLRTTIFLPVRVKRETHTQEHFSGND
jgi:hypothetical protein